MPPPPVTPSSPASASSALSPGENAPLIAAVERLTVAANARAPALLDLPNDAKLLHWRDANGDLKSSELAAKPPRPAGELTVQTVAGFAEAVRQLRSAGTPPLVVYEDESVEAVLNRYTADNANYADHKVVFAPPLSAEWKRWLLFCGRPQPRGEAREFVEDNARDFAPPAEGCVDRSALATWLDRLSLKVVREIDQADNAEGERTTAEGSATLAHVTRLSLRVHEGGPAIGFRCRWRARLREGALVVQATVVNASEAERRAWLGPVPDGAGWVPLVEQVAAALELPVIV